MRLGMTQDGFAEMAGVSKRALANYESGDRKPDSDFLTALAAHGVDVLYVLTGQRVPVSLLAAVPSSPPPPVPALSSDEAELLSDYRESHPVVRRSIKTLLREAASSSGGGVASPPRRRKRG